MRNAKIFIQLCEQLACTKFVKIQYGKKQSDSLNEIRCQEAMKKVPTKRYHRTDNSLTLHLMSLLSITCTYLEDLWIVLQLQFEYEFYEEAHGRMALRPLMMSQSATPHKLLNDLLCEFPIVSLLFFL